MTRDFPTIQEVIVIHGILIETFGGAPGIRDEGALASALMRPQLGYYEGLIEQAAALMESLGKQPSLCRREQTGGLLRHRHLPAHERPLHRLRRR